jgi:hypothetical protein
LVRSEAHDYTQYDEENARCYSLFEEGTQLENGKGEKGEGRGMKKKERKKMDSVFLFLFLFLFPSFLT